MARRRKSGTASRSNSSRLLAVSGNRSDKPVTLPPGAVALIASFRPAVLDRDGTTLDPAEFVQSLHKSSNPLAHGPSGTHTQEADGRHLALLRACRDGPSSGSAAEQQYELAALQPRDHSITSSAIASSLSGTVRPSAFAVLRLITSSNRVGCTTGSSAGLAPLRICAV